MTGCGARVDPLAAPPGCVVITTERTTWVTVTVPDVALVRPDAANVMVCAPAPLICKLLNVAMPFTAFTVVVPTSVPVPDANDAVTAFVAPTTTPFAASRTCTTGWVPNATPLSEAALGCVATNSCVAGSAVITTLPDVAESADGTVIEKVRVWVPAPVMARLANDATPETALTAVVPPNTPGPDALVAVTVLVAAVTVRPA